MNMLKNERGIALVLVLILALISLAIVSSLLYMLTMGTRGSGAERFYRTADEAAFGGTRIAVDMIVNNVGNAVAGGALSAPFAATLGSTLNNQACLRQKLSLAPGAGFANWGACSANERNLNAATTPDMTFQLSGATADGMPTPFNVYAKVVGTVEGNTAGTASSSSGTSGLSTGGVGGGGASVVTPARLSWIYRIEVEAENSVNPRERSRYSVLFSH